jgi:hypothetical protein
MLKILKKTLMMLVFATATIPAAHATFLTDMWWKPDESGWGANIVSQEDISFITLFVYDINGEPIWYVAPAARQVALTPTGLPVLNGKLYRTRGPWRGGVFDPTKVAIAAEGTIDVEPISTSDAKFRYQIDGVTVTKLLTRQTWKTITDLPSSFGYHATMQLVKSTHIPSTPKTSITSTGSFTAEITANDARFTYQNTDKTCIYTGRITQTGKFSNFEGPYACTNGETGHALFNELEVNRHGFTAQIVLIDSNAMSGGSIAGAKKR